jgi:CHASE2 domain-containing sensor protein
LPRIARHWQALRPVYRTTIYTMAVAMAVVFAIYTIFYLARFNGFVADAIDSAYDQRMAIDANIPGAEAPPPVLIDFDDTTMARLGDPAFVPPAAEASIIDTLVALRPRAVFFDLDLSYLRDEAQIRPIAAALTRLADSGVPVLLARDILPPLTEGAPRRLRPTPLDPVVAAAPNLMWVDGSVSRDRIDGVARRIPVIDTATLGGPPVPLPSPALVLFVLERTGSLAETERIILAAAQGRAPCGAGGPPRSIVICTPRGNTTIDLNNHRRIDYRLGWNSSAALPAYPLLAHGRDVDPEPFASRIVIIGSSAGYRDFVQTPLKRMPGALAHANAIHAWLAFGPDPGISYWRGALFVVPFTALAALLVVLAIFSLPRRFRPAARTAAPFVMTILFWLAFHLFGAPSASVGLLVVAYFMVAVIAFFERHFERLYDPPSPKPE